MNCASGNRAGRSPAGHRTARGRPPVSARARGADARAPRPAQGCTPGPAQGCTPRPAQGCTPGPSQGCTPGPAQGCTPGPAQGCTPGPAQGCTPGPAQGCLDRDGEDGQRGAGDDARHGARIRPRPRQPARRGARAGDLAPRLLHPMPQHRAVGHGDRIAFAAAGERSRQRGYQRRRDQDRGSPGMRSRRYGLAQRTDLGDVRGVPLAQAPDDDLGLVWRLPHEVTRLAVPRATVSRARPPYLPVPLDPQERGAQARELARGQGVNRRELQVGRGQHQFPPPAGGVPADRRPGDDDRDTDHQPANFAHARTISTGTDIRAGPLPRPGTPAEPSLPVRHYVANMPICPIEMAAELTYSGDRLGLGIDLSRMAVLKISGAP